MGRSSYGNSVKGASGSGGERCQGKGTTAQWEFCSNGQDGVDEVTDDCARASSGASKRSFGRQATGEYQGTNLDWGKGFLDPYFSLPLMIPTYVSRLIQ